MHVRTRVCYWWLHKSMLTHLYPPSVATYTQNTLYDPSPACRNTNLAQLRLARGWRKTPFTAFLVARECTSYNGPLGTQTQPRALSSHSPVGEMSCTGSGKARDQTKSIPISHTVCTCLKPAFVHMYVCMYISAIR